ncbi:MAG: DNA polymerase I [Candidatus Aminicenantes bacterium]|nr:DNA polymerase I [Candidatus Aminicenantes bacterium]
MDKIFLIDGNSLLYRSYYAIRNLSNSKGFATNAIYGFIQTIRKLMEKENPKYLGIAFDSKGPTFRHKIFPDYKAHRKPMPEDLAPQLPVLKKLLKAYKIKVFAEQGFEGDDILASLAKKASKNNVLAVIVTNDKDLYQVVSDSVMVYNVAKESYMDKKAVEESIGVPPSKVKDLLSLWGDPTDNIPGVKGVGAKTAKKLLLDYGSVDNLINNPEKIKNPRIKEKIKNSRKDIDISRKLVSINTDMPIEFNLNDLILTDPDYEELIPILEELEFSKLLSDYLYRVKESKKDYSLIVNEQDLDALIDQIKKSKKVSIDTETNSPNPTEADLVGISFSLKPHQAFYLPLRHDYPGAPKQLPLKNSLNRLSEIFSDPEIKKIGQNIKYDCIVLKREGAPLKGIDIDTMILSYLCEPNLGKHNLDSLALKHLHVKTTSYEEIAGKGKDEVTLDKVDVNKVMPYACEDADITLQLSSVLMEKAREKNLTRLYRDIEQPLIEVLTDMEIWGITVDPGVLKTLSEELEESITRLEKKIYEQCGEEFNINSPQQLGEVLFVRLGLPSSKKTKKTGRFSTSFGVLENLSSKYPVVKEILEYRKLSKLKSTYADALPKLINKTSGRIHTSYNQTIASTGRLSSSYPNLQNIPIRGEWGMRFRRAFIPPPEHLFLSADYSQIELRVLAHLSEDPELIKTFENDRDVHKETADKVFGKEASLFRDEFRRRAKIINFSIIYGTSPFSLAKQLETSTSEAKKFIDLYFERYPQVMAFQQACVKEAEEKGYSETLFGRKRPIPELKSKNKVIQQAGQRIALNTPIQGTAADLMKKAMRDIWEEIKKNNLNSKIILQVHDELVFEVPDAEQKLMEQIAKEKMEKVLPLKVPLKVHLGWGVNWAEAK